MSSGGNYSVYNATINALERAVKERVLMVCEDGLWKTPFRPSEKQFALRVSSFAERMKKLVRYSTPMSPLAFAMTFQGRKRTILLNAAKLNEERGFSDRCASIRPFLKHEKYLFSEGKSVIPRVIQPRDQRYIVETGRYIKPIEKLIYKAIDTVYGEATVFKGLNMEDRGNLLWKKWNRFKRPIAISIDVSKFDRSVSNAALKWEHKMYQAYYPGDRYFRRLMRLQRSNHGFGCCRDGFLTYATKHNRASGDSNTSLGNVLLMCGMVFDYLESIGIEMSVADDGDDCVILLEWIDAEKLSGLSSWFKKAGFPVVIERPVEVFEQIVFCQSSPVRNYDGGYTMVRNPRASVGKDAVALKPLDNVSIARKWMAAVGDGGMALTSGMPVLQEYYSVYKRNSNGATPLVDTTIDGGFFRLSKGMTKDYRKPTDQTRMSFWLAFGITPEEQVSLEEYYRGITLGEGNILCRFNTLPM
jgi:hypothetical protein